MEDDVSIRPNITKTDDNRPMTPFEKLGNVHLRNKVEDSQTRNPDLRRSDEFKMPYNQSLFQDLLDYLKPPSEYQNDSVRSAKRFVPPM